MKRKYNVATDILSMILLLAAIITGFVLHRDVWHIHVYNDIALWGAHECVGLILFALVIMHCVQHSFWFRNYGKIKAERKRVTTLLLIIGIIVAITGIILMCGSRSETVSHIHYAGAILFTAVALGHILKRRKNLKSLLKS